MQQVLGSTGYSNKNTVLLNDWNRILKKMKKYAICYNF